MPSQKVKSLDSKSRPIRLLLFLVLLLAGVAWGQEDQAPAGNPAVAGKNSAPQGQAQAGEDLGAVREEILTALKKAGPVIGGGVPGKPRRQGGAGAERDLDGSRGSVEPDRDALHQPVGASREQGQDQRGRFGGLCQYSAG
jgi:hypothetical protein